MFTEEIMNTSVKKTIFGMALLLVPALFSYAGDLPARTSADFSQVQQRDWNLVEVKGGSSTVVIDRSKVQREIYSIRFEADRVRGRGGDNIYIAAYTAGANNSLSIRRIAGTYMLPIFENESFTEYEYYRHLERVQRWELHDWKLQLHTRDENGAGVVLVFTPIYK